MSFHNLRNTPHPRSCFHHQVSPDSYIVATHQMSKVPVAQLAMELDSPCRLTWREPCACTCPFHQPSFIPSPTLTQQIDSNWCDLEWPNELQWLQQFAEMAVRVRWRLRLAFGMCGLVPHDGETEGARGILPAVIDVNKGFNWHTKNTCIRILYMIIYYVIILYTTHLCWQQELWACQMNHPWRFQYAAAIHSVIPWSQMNQRNVWT